MMLSAVKGIGNATLARLATLGITDVGGLLSFLPSKYVNLDCPSAILDCDDGSFSLIEGVVLSVTEPSKRGTKAFTVTMRDRLSPRKVVFRAVFYNQPYLFAEFREGREFRLLTKINYSADSLTLVNPTVEPLDNIKRLQKGIYTVYPLRGELGQKTFKNLVESAFESVGYSSLDIRFDDLLPSIRPTEYVQGDLFDYVDESAERYPNDEIADIVDLNQSHSSICANSFDLESKEHLNFVDNNRKILADDLDCNRDDFAFDTEFLKGYVYDVLHAVHFPKDKENAIENIEKLSAIDFAIGLKNYHNSRISASKERKVFYNLPFSVIDKAKTALILPLTPTQDKAILKVFDDLNSKNNLSRIVSGDVGSGKSLVAYASMIFAFFGGRQSAYMCPTEILATQQYNKFLEIAKNVGIKVALLTSSTPIGVRKTILNGLANGEINCVFGTNSLVGRDVNYHNLTLAVIDEQHRFGVECRAQIESKGACDVLSLTATPIPRTLALTLYEDIDVSYIVKRKEATTNITTKILTDGKLEDMLAYVNNECVGGKQAFIICPTISDSEGLDLYSVEDFFKSYADTFSVSCSVLHGKMSNEDKKRVMTDFAEKRISILFATSLVEVGIDTTAGIIAILNADRFGLASLHQLRGRVGRDGSPAYCFLHTKSHGEKAIQRLRALEKICDGNLLAEKDLEMRGSGEMLGTKQKGANASPYFSLPLDYSSLRIAKTICDDKRFAMLENAFRDVFTADYTDFVSAVGNITLNS